MRVRVTLRALWALWDKRALLNPLRFPLFSWQLASHKLLRYLSFRTAYGSSAAYHRAGNSRMGVCLRLPHGQLCVLFLALLASQGPRRARTFSLARYSYYFLLLNCGLCRGSVALHFAETRRTHLATACWVDLPCH